MTPDQAKAAATMFASLWEGEFPATCQVLAAVKDDQPGLQARSEVAHRVAACHPPRDRRSLVHRLHRQWQIPLRSRAGKEAGSQLRDGR